MACQPSVRRAVSPDQVCCGDGRLGIFVRLHHVLADGLAGIASLAALLDTVPDVPSATPPGWYPGRRPPRARWSWTTSDGGPLSCDAVRPSSAGRPSSSAT
jgi:hypothetical protein